MSGNCINFDDKKIKSDFYKKKQNNIDDIDIDIDIDIDDINIDDIDANKIVSKKETCDKYNSPLCLKLSKMTVYINEFNENKNTITMSLRVNDEQLFKNIIK